MHLGAQAKPLPVAADPRLSAWSAEERIRWCVEQFGEDAVLLSSMQKTSAVLMHLFHALGLSNEILFVDTGFHFQETLRLRDEFMLRYRLNLVTLYPELTPVQQEVRQGRQLYLFADGQPECCRQRKELPFLKHMRERGRRVVLLGLLQAEGGRRGAVGPWMADPRIPGYSLHPLYDWDAERVDEYLQAHDVPIHPLHLQGYPSIGCQPCTTPVAPGEDPRAGRWRHLRTAGQSGPQYCGLNVADGSGI